MRLDQITRDVSETLRFSAYNWWKRSPQLFRDIVILMRDTGMRNERELYRMRIEKLD